jgi:hypothetical protein
MHNRRAADMRQAAANERAPTATAPLERSIGRLQGLLQRLRAFLGIGLPPRNIELRFELAGTSRQGRRPPLSPERAHALLGEHSTTPQEYLKALLGLVGDLNRWPLHPQRRLALLESLTGWFYAAVAPALLELIAAGGGVPESPDRRDTLELQDRCAASLVDGYRLLFAADYACSNFTYNRIRPRVYRVACRILELIKLRQRIAGVRYLRLDARTWRTAHTVFAAMRACEPVDQVVDTLSLRNQGLDRRTQASLRQHYVSLATYGILDADAWPEREQLAIDSYIAAVPEAVRVLDYEPGRDARPWYLYASCYDEGPPARTPPADASHGPTLLLDHRNLAATIRDDCRALEQAIETRDSLHIPLRLARIDADRRIPFAYLLQRNLRGSADWPEDETAAQQHRDLRIYVGFPEVRAHLLSIFRQDDGRLKRSRELSDLFAQRSAVIGEDETAPQRSLWYVLQDSQESMRIRTQETRFTNSMFVGNLLAYGFGEDEVRTPRIGKVNRIFRPVTGIVMLDIDYLASFATPVQLFGLSQQNAMQPESNPDPTPITEQELDGEPMTALLIFHPQQGWGIVTPPQDRLWQGAHVCIKTGNRLTRAQLGETRDVTNEFCRFRVNAAALPGKPPQYPSAASQTSAPPEHATLPQT